jgi:acetyl-CoA synthetase (ADP-forming)
MKIIEAALEKGKTTLTEHEAKSILAHYQIPITREVLVKTDTEAVAAAGEIGYPVVMKGSGENLAHKTELDLIKLDLGDEEAVRQAFLELTTQSRATVEDVLVQQMIKGDRELMAGLTRDPQFGPCVLFGLGGIFAEVLEDVSFRVMPFDRNEALEMMQEIRAKKILGAFRGKPAVDLESMADILLLLGQIGMDHDLVKEIDINPLKLVNGRPVVVDALFVLEGL